MSDMASKIDELRSAFDAYNVNRVYLATLNFSEKENNFFRVIPVLLHYAVDLFDTSQTAPHGICSFKPQSLHLDSFNELFPDANQLEMKSNDYPILSLALMGSIGTVAQTDKSDFDYVVLLEKNRLSEKEFEELSQKLSSIEKWAMEKLHIEVHFFPQDVVEFRENRFGLTDEESAGSAGGKLLKDEFFRTAIFISGKRPLWWIIPPGMPEEKMEAFKIKLPSWIAEKANDYVDLGHILHIEAQEFFGAALWHMSKFLNSPYKSLLKMALLESYLFYPQDDLLCEKLKMSILQPGKEGRVPDPYIMMCERVTDDYLKSGVSKDEIRIVQAAFLLKTGLNADILKELLAKPLSDLNDKESVVARLLMKWNWGADDLNLLSDNILGKDNKFLLSGKVSSFLLNSYKRVSDWLQQSGIKANLISMEDLTVLGRKLFAFFEKKPGKVPFLLPGQMPKEPPKCISIIYDKLSEKDPKWCCFDFHLYGTESYDLRNISPPIATFSSLIETLNWTLINRFWNPGVKMIFEGRNSIFRQKDIEKLMTNLFTFLIADSYVPSREDYLSKKRLVKAFAILNFSIKDSSKNLSEVDLVFINSWGEFIINHFDSDQAAKETADMIVFAKSEKKPPAFKVFAPFHENKASFCKKFENSVNELVDPNIKKFKPRKKKARLDTFT